MATTTPRTLAKDADFQALYGSAISMGAAILRAGSKLSAAAKKARIADIQSGDATRARAALNAIGVSEPVLEEQRRLLLVVVDRHDLPLDATLPGTIGDATVALKQSYDDEHGGGPAPDPLDELEDELDLPPSSGSGDDDDNNNDTCYSECAALAVVLGANAVGAYMIAMAGCTAGGPFAFLCWAGATAAYGLALWQMDAAIDRCVANCAA